MRLLFALEFTTWQARWTPHPPAGVVLIHTADCGRRAPAIELKPGNLLDAASGARIARAARSAHPSDREPRACCA